MMTVDTQYNMLYRHNKENLLEKEFGSVVENAKSVDVKEGVRGLNTTLESKFPSKQMDSNHESESEAHGLLVRELDEGMVWFEDDVLDGSSLNEQFFQEWFGHRMTQVRDLEGPPLQVSHEEEAGVRLKCTCT